MIMRRRSDPEPIKKSTGPGRENRETVVEVEAKGEEGENLHSQLYTKLLLCMHA